MLPASLARGRAAAAAAVAARSGYGEFAMDAASPPPQNPNAATPQPGIAPQNPIRYSPYAAAAIANAAHLVAFDAAFFAHHHHQQPQLYAKQTSYVTYANQPDFSATPQTIVTNKSPVTLQQFGGDFLDTPNGSFEVAAGL